MRQVYDSKNPNNLKHRAWDSVKEFFGEEEKDHALSPGLIASLGNFSTDAPPSALEEAPGLERRYRLTEKRRIARNPNAVWPG
jgi:hypothetical protein